MNKDISKIYFSSDDIQKKINDMAKELDAFYKGEEVLLVGGLKGQPALFCGLGKGR